MRNGSHHTDESKRKMSKSRMGNTSRRGTPTSDEGRKNMSVAHLGQTPWNKGRSWTEEERAKISAGVKKLWDDSEYRKMQSEAHKGKHGSDASNWQGGKCKETALIRNSSEMATWRKFVFERDDYTCQECLQYGGELRAHHCKSFVDYPHLRFQTWNGLTLCKDCHANYHGGIG